MFGVEITSGFRINKLSHGWMIARSTKMLEWANQIRQETGQGCVLSEVIQLFNGNGYQCDVVLRLNKILYGQAKSAHLCYEKW